MATTRDELIGFVEDLYIPKIARYGLESVIHAAQEAMEVSILLFASGEGGEQPDLVGWLDKRNLLSDDGLDEPPGESVMAENYSSRQSEVNTKKDEMDQQSHKVKDSAFKTFSLSNDTYMSIKERVGKLDKDLRDINQRTDEGGAYLPLTFAEETRAMRYVLQAVEDVHDAVEGASDQIRNQAADIDGSRRPSRAHRAVMVLPRQLFRHRGPRARPAMTRPETALSTISSAEHGTSWISVSVKAAATTSPGYTTNTAGSWRRGRTTYPTPGVPPSPAGCGKKPVTRSTGPTRIMCPASGRTPRGWDWRQTRQTPNPAI